WKIMGDYHPHPRYLRENSMNRWIGECSSPLLVTMGTRCQHNERRAKPAAIFQTLAARAKPYFWGVAGLLLTSTCATGGTSGNQSDSVLPPGRNWKLMMEDKFNGSCDKNITTRCAAPPITSMPSRRAHIKMWQVRHSQFRSGSHTRGGQVIDGNHPPFAVDWVRYYQDKGPSQSLATKIKLTSPVSLAGC